MAQDSGAFGIATSSKRMEIEAGSTLEEWAVNHNVVNRVNVTESQSILRKNEKNLHIYTYT